MMARWVPARVALFLFFPRRLGERSAGCCRKTEQGYSTRPARAPRMEYQDAVRTLNTLQTNASLLEQVKRERGSPQLQLEAMRSFLERSGLTVGDLDQLNIIHVSGTKGKGSTCAFSEQILRNYGLKTGFYSSPHLVQVRERIRINGQPISKELFTKYFWQVYNQLDKTKDDHCDNMPAYFRFLTILAFHVFLQEKVDLAVIEVGIGGAYDCTNIIRKPVVCGVSSLGIDHTSLLGDTIEKIAWQKGGIFKTGVPAFTVPQPDGPMEVLQERAREIGCPLYVCPGLEEYERDGVKFQLGLAGEHQRVNAALALQLCRTWLHRQRYPELDAETDSSPADTLGLSIHPPTALPFRLCSPTVKGLRDAEWPGRTQILKHGPLTYYLDGAHTIGSVNVCTRWFREMSLKEELAVNGSVVRVLLFNVMGERDTAAFLKLLMLCQFDFAVFCPNLTEVLSTGNADQHNFNISLENILTRCLDNQKKWNKLMEEKYGGGIWTKSSLEVMINQERLHDGLLLLPRTEDAVWSRVFPCISSALNWVTQGRDPHLQTQGSTTLNHYPVSSSDALLQEAASIQVLVTGSLHLVGGVLNLLDQSMSQ
ncbi:folylpolyglutamate synthase, mitochondrial isoform X2 [Latimeria chalumnae]|uniref:folylpolyglutamate synthase, mitochondrial isoform X2 n=1 Tax=Latimeria chalumnae TaxID=7897 RepID=UPI00313CBAB3